MQWDRGYTGAVGPSSSVEPAVLSDSPALDAPGHMALDEAMLSGAASGALILRFYRWKVRGGFPPSPRRPVAATFGYFQDYGTVLAEIRVRGPRPSFPVVRRPTGGGVVLHDGDITFSLVFPWDRLSAASEIYRNLHHAIHLRIEELGIASRLWSSSAKTRASCFIEPSPMDLVREDGVKFLGGALRRRHGKGLYQGSLRPQHLNASRVSLEEAVRKGIEARWGVRFGVEPPARELLGEAMRLRTERYVSRDWNERRDMAIRSFSGRAAPGLE